jgi:hypothetical protein
VKVRGGGFVSVTSGIVVLLGLWLIASRWVIGAPGPNVATNAVVCGALVAVCGGIRFSRRTAAMSWVNALLGAWTVAAPWIFGQHSGDIHTWNYTLTGIAIAGLETLSLTSSAIRHP